MKNFLKQTFQPKTDKTTIKNTQNNSKEKIISKNKTKEIKLKPKISQEIMNTNLSLLGIHPVTQNLKKENKDKENKEKENKEKLNLKNIKETFIKKNNENEKDAKKNINNNIS